MSVRIIASSKAASYYKLGGVIIVVAIAFALGFWSGMQHPLALPSPVGSTQALVYSDPDIEAALQECLSTEEGASTAGMRTCLNSALERYRTQQTSAYAAAIGSIDAVYAEVEKSNAELDIENDGELRYFSDARASLVKGEDAWKVYSSSFCSAEIDMLWTSGTGAGPAYAECMISFSRKHIQELRELYATIQF